MPGPRQVLVVAENRRERSALISLLTNAGFTAFGAEGADKALGYADDAIDVVCVSVELSELDGPELRRLWMQRRPGTKFIFLDNRGQRSEFPVLQADAIVESSAAQAGLVLTLNGILQTPIPLPAPLADASEDDAISARIVGRSDAIKEIRRKVARAATSDATVLVLGESGVGKGLVAETLHQLSPYRAGPFFVVTCGTVFADVPNWHLKVVEQVRGGTVFFDEVGDYGLDLQAKVLQILDALPRNGGPRSDPSAGIRVLAATNRDVGKLLQAGSLREDLYYRLRVVTITVPPLRERRDDIPILAAHFLAQMGAARGILPKRFGPGLLIFLQNHPWPGNVRELRNTLEVMTVMSDGDVLTEADLPFPPDERLDGAPSPAGSATAASIADLERRAVVQALEACRRNRTHAALRLGVSVRTLQRKIRQWGL